MSLIKCEECGKEISDKAGKCPHCGYPVPFKEANYESTKSNKVVLDNTKLKKEKEPMLLLPLVLLVLATFLAIISNLLAITLLLFSILFSIIALFDNPKKKTGFIVILSISLFFLLGNAATCAVKVSKDTGTDNSAKKMDVLSTEPDSTSTILVQKETEKNVNKNIQTTIDSNVIYDGNNVIIKVTGMEEDSSSVSIDFYIENNSKINLSFNAHSYSVNSIMTKDNIYAMDTDVAIGKKANTSLSIEKSTLDSYGIKDIKNIKVLFWAYDSDAQFKSFETPQIDIKTNKYDETILPDDSKNVLSDTNMDVGYLGSSDNNYNFVITNKNDDYFDFTIENLSINDYTVTDIDYDLYDTQVLGKNKIYITIKANDEFKKSNNIDAVKKLDFDIRFSFKDGSNEQKTGMISLDSL